MKKILFLHGAIGASPQLQPLADRLASRYEPHLFDFTGHGGRDVPEDPFSIALFAGDVIGWMDKSGVPCADIFGYSMGGYVAMYLAANFPGRVGRIFTLATKIDWSPAGAERESAMLDPEKIAEKIPAFAETLAKRHAPADWKVVLKKTASMMRSLGEAPILGEEAFARIGCPVLLSVGDRDKMVSIEETVRAYRSIRNASVLVLPGTPHAVESADLSLLDRAMSGFFG